MSYDTWKTTDPADRDPYRDDGCPVCRVPAGYKCTPECDCDACVLAAEKDERDEALACPQPDERHPDEDDGRTYADPRDEREERRNG